MQKIIFILLVILVTNSYNCNSVNAHFTMQTRSERLIEYQVDKCVYDLLLSIVLSNNQFYSPSKYYYSFEFHIDKERRELYIAPEMWNNARTLAYNGVICIKGNMFLCKGNYAEDPLFKKTKNTINVTLKLSKNEVGLLQNFNEPSLEGTMNICEGIPLDISVYTKGKISGYSTK
ncbi:hypothetical protein DVR12_07940 [Chitinophaga silvatica]|uniref:Uncharacterized protein n=1 Tax=Chitinophaga silvatica TaxID=2282649 RepID=A0A3E1YEZ7_9BACT|nr:hypothetical protein [Chitinophaga silvatica]RFS25105.1 hypothetical protein DVR12_07940 [Chitinophaga silvatica]